MFMRARLLETSRRDSLNAFACARSENYYSEILWLIISKKQDNRENCVNQIVSLIFEANLSFSALLLAVMGILVSLYLRAEHARWKSRFRVLLALCGGTFFIGIIECALSLLYIVTGFPSASEFTFNLIIALFVGELAILGFAGLLLIMMLVI
jgi:hypothetical protein